MLLIYEFCLIYSSSNVFFPLVAKAFSLPISKERLRCCILTSIWLSNMHLSEPTMDESKIRRAYLMWTIPMDEPHGSLESAYLKWTLQWMIHVVHHDLMSEEGCVKRFMKFQYLSNLNHASRARARTHTRARAHTHTHTHSLSLSLTHTHTHKEREREMPSKFKIHMWALIYNTWTILK